MQVYKINKDTRKEQFAGRGMKEHAPKGHPRSTGRKNPKRRKTKKQYNQNVFGSPSVGSGRW